MLEQLTAELRLLILHELKPAALANVPATCKLWRAFVVHYFAARLRLGADLRNAIAPAGHPRLSRLQHTPVLITVGGYNTRWNGHAWCDMSEDGPGCERSAEVVCTLEAAECSWCGVGADWQQPPPMSQRRADCALVADCPSIVYAIGGREGGEAQRSVESLRLSHWQLYGEGWSAEPPLQHARYGHVGARLGDALFAAGGGHHHTLAQDGTRVQCTAEMLRLDAAPGERTWQLLPRMRRRRSYAASAVVHGEWYVMGGVAGGSSQRVEVFHPGVGEWRDEAPMSCSRYAAAAATYCGAVLVIGGCHAHEPLASSAEYLDPRAAHMGWRPLHLSYGVKELQGAAAVVHGDSLFVLGGAWPTAYHDEGPGRSSRVVRIFDLRRPGLVSQEVENFEAPVEVGHLSGAMANAAQMRVPRWCGAACVVHMAC